MRAKEVKIAMGGKVKTAVRKPTRRTVVKIAIVMGKNSS